MMARAGGLDQGNIITNLLDMRKDAGTENYLLLAGSAINGIKNDKGEYDPAIGAEAMLQALQSLQERCIHRDRQRPRRGVEISMPMRTDLMP